MIRRALLFGLLIVECVAIYMLHSLGWSGALGLLHLISALSICILPAAIAIVVIGWRGRKFSLRSLMAATSFVAIFLAVFVLPYTRARRSRQITQKLDENGIGFRTESYNHYLASAGLGSDQPAGSVSKTPAWIQPLLAGLPVPSEEIREIWLWSDEAIGIVGDLCSDLPNLQTVYVWGRKDGATCVSSAGLRELSRQLPSVDRLVITDIAVPQECCRSFAHVRVLSICAMDTNSPLSQLSGDQLRDIASTPGLEVLFVSGCNIDDHGAEILAASPGLRHLGLDGAQVTEQVQAQIREKHPDLTVKFTP